MKKLLLIPTMLLLLTGCNEEVVQQEEQQIETELQREVELRMEVEPQNATIYYDPSGSDNCTYIFKTEYNQYYATPKLDEEFRENNLRVKVSFIKTSKIMNCGFAGPLPLVKIAAIEKIEQQIDFVEIGKGRLLVSWIGAKPSNLVITNQTDWEALMTKMGSEIDYLTQTNIDFSDVIIIAVFDEVRPDAAYEITIENINEERGAILVRYATNTLRGGLIAFSQPFHIVKIPKTDKQIAFEKI